MGRADGHSVRRVVLLAGFMQGASTWRPAADSLGPRWEPVLLDFETDDFDSRRAEIAAAAGPGGSVIVGYSMGGRLALHEASRHLERYAALVVIGASPGIEPEAAREERRARDEALAAWIETQPIEAVVDFWEAHPVLSDQPPDLVVAQRAERLRHDPRRLACTLRSAGPGAVPSLWPSLEELALLPLLALAGERDSTYAAAGRRMAAALPRAEAAVVPGAGHAAHLERPAEVARLIAGFLDRVVAPLPG